MERQDTACLFVNRQLTILFKEILIWEFYWSSKFGADTERWEFDGTKRTANWMEKVKNFFPKNFAQILVGTSMECICLRTFHMVRKTAEVGGLDSDRDKVGTKKPKSSPSSILPPVFLPIGNRLKFLPESMSPCLCGPVGHDLIYLQWGNSENPVETKNGLVRFKIAT